jgi:hypothetical protein
MALVNAVASYNNSVHDLTKQPPALSRHNAPPAHLCVATHSNVSNKVNVKDLKLADGLDDCPPPPAYVGLDGTLWAVESILNSKTTKRDGTFLLVHWTSFDGPYDDTWEPLRNLLHLHPP